MKTDDFERLKAVCEKEGFEISIANRSLKDVFEIHKKDPWEGVEFAECVKNLLCAFTEGKIYRILTEINQEECFIDDEGDINGLGLENKEYFKPSTESAYVEQLKKEALERLPNIKEGDILKTDWTIDNVKISKGVSGFCYIKYGDMLLYNTTAIYKEGKWAERVKERVKVTYSGASCKPHPIRNDMDLHEVRFYVNHTNGLPTSNAFDFLASQLEKYLNGEIE